MFNQLIEITHMYSSSLFYLWDKTITFTTKIDKTVDKSNHVFYWLMEPHDWIQSNS